MKIKRSILGVLPVFISITLVLGTFFIVFSPKGNPTTYASTTFTAPVYPAPDVAQRIEMLYNCSTLKSSIQSIDTSEDENNQRAISVAVEISQKIISLFEQVLYKDDYTSIVPRGASQAQSEVEPYPTVTAHPTPAPAEVKSHLRKYTCEEQGKGAISIYTVDVYYPDYEYISFYIKLDAETLLPYSIQVYSPLILDMANGSADILQSILRDYWQVEGAVNDGEVAALLYEYYYDKKALPFVEGVWYPMSSPRIKCSGITLHGRAFYVVSYTSVKSSEDTTFIITKELLDGILTTSQ